MPKRNPSWYTEELRVGAMTYREKTKKACVEAHDRHVERLLSEPVTRPILLRARSGRIMYGYFDVQAASWCVEYLDTETRENIAMLSLSVNSGDRGQVLREMRRHMADMEEDPSWVVGDEEGLEHYRRKVVFRMAYQEAKAEYPEAGDAFWHAEAGRRA